jgi:hypothetical protein
MKNEKFYPSITPPLAVVIAMLILAGTVVASDPQETVLPASAPARTAQQRTVA